MTATSATAGARCSTCSTSMGYTFSPPVMIMSFLRSTSVTKPCLVRPAEVTGVEPPPAHGLRGLGGQAPVAGEDVRAAEDELPDLAGLDVVILLVDDPDVDVHEGPPDRAGVGDDELRVEDEGVR